MVQLGQAAQGLPLLLPAPEIALSSQIGVGPEQEPLRLGVAALEGERVSQVPPRGRRLMVPGAEKAAVDGERFSQERFGLGWFPPLVQQGAKVPEYPRGFGASVGKRCPIDSQRLAEESFRLLHLAGEALEDAEVPKTVADVQM